MSTSSIANLDSSMPPTQGSADGLPLWSAGPCNPLNVPPPAACATAPLRHRRRVSFGPDQIILITPRQTQHLTETCDSIPTPQDEEQTQSVVIPLGARLPMSTEPLGAGHDHVAMPMASLPPHGVSTSVAGSPPSAWVAHGATPEWCSYGPSDAPTSSGAGQCERSIESLQEMAAVDRSVPMCSQSSSLPLLPTCLSDVAFIDPGQHGGGRTDPIVCGSASTLDSASSPTSEQTLSNHNGFFGSLLPEAQQVPSFGSTTLDEASIGSQSVEGPVEGGQLAENSSARITTADHSTSFATQRDEHASDNSTSNSDTCTATSSSSRYYRRDDAADEGDATQRIAPPPVVACSSSSSSILDALPTPERLSSYYYAAEGGGTAVSTPTGPACVFCRQQDDAVLLHSGYYLHVHCALWCPEVYCDPMSEQFRHIPDALQRTQNLKCALCRQPGASIGCLEGSCERSYHYHCAQAARCHMHPSPCDAEGPASPASGDRRRPDVGQDNFVMHCPAHSPVRIPCAPKPVTDPEAEVRSASSRKKRARTE